MTISLIPSMDVISDIEYCSPLTCFYSNSLCCVLDEQGKLRILKYDLGEYLLKIFSGVPVFIMESRSIIIKKVMSLALVGLLIPNYH